MANDRKEFALRRGFARASACVELREPPGLSDGDADSNRRSQRARRRRMWLFNSACAAARAAVEGLPAPALGHLGLCHWIAGARLRRRRDNHDPSRFSMAWLFPACTIVGPAL